MGLRYLLLGLAIWAGLAIIRHLIRQHRLRQEHPMPAKSVNSVQCAYCGLHLPSAEALQQGSEFFCTREHQQAYRREHSE